MYHVDSHFDLHARVLKILVETFGHRVLQLNNVFYLPVGSLPVARLTEYSRGAPDWFVLRRSITAEVLIVTDPNSGAETIPFLKTCATVLNKNAHIHTQPHTHTFSMHLLLFDRNK